MAHKKWYQKPQYKQPLPLTKLDDGSSVECIPVSEEIVLVIRQWANGNTDRVRITQDVQGRPQYELAKKDRFGQAIAFIGDPDWTPPYVYSNAIPGTSPSSIKTHDLGTGEDFETRRKRDKHYDELGLTLVTRAEALNMHDRTPPKASKELSRGQFRGNAPLAPAGTVRSAIRADLTKVK